MKMKVGFIGFGEVASILARGLMEQGVEVFTCLEGRTDRTKELARSMEVELCINNRELADTMDMVLSAVIPSQVVRVAQEVGEIQGIYVDLNNVSPNTVQEALKQVGDSNTVDASIMGSIRKKGLKVKIIASGGAAKEFAQLNDYGMDIEVIGSEPGQASAIKMLRSAYTKGVSALLIESLHAAYQMGIDEEVFKYISQTEGSGFQESAVSRMTSSLYHARRRSEEMEEVVKMMSQETEPFMSGATLEFFQVLDEKIGKLDKRPANMHQVFQKLEGSGHEG
jgi:3-hydroxyisobutyrate dehydrogenase-like beta-hydroxyacid dehydrogenase